MSYIPTLSNFQEILAQNKHEILWCTKVIQLSTGTPSRGQLGEAFDSQLSMQF